MHGAIPPNIEAANISPADPDQNQIENWILLDPQIGRFDFYLARLTRIAKCTSDKKSRLYASRSSITMMVQRSGLCSIEEATPLDTLD